MNEILAFANVPIMELVRTAPAFAKFKSQLLQLIATYKATGHAIDESQFYIVFDTYSIYRTLFSSDEQRRIHIWILSIGRGQIKSFNDGINIKNNWQTHRIKTVACAARVINNTELYTWAYAQLYKHISTNLLPDGRCHDWLERDSISYVTYNMVAFIIAINNLKSRYSDDFYNYESPNGSSIKKSVNFVIPYIEGTLTNVMFINSTVFSDKDKSGRGKVWEKTDAKNMIRLAMVYDKSLEGCWNKHFR